MHERGDRLLAELRRRRVEAEGRYQLAALSGYGWEPDGLRWAGAVQALADLEQWACPCQAGETGDRANSPFPQRDDLPERSP